MSVRPVKEIIHPKPTLEGAGVRLQRGFGFGNTTEYDPFLLFDDFRNDNPRDYLAGFPWHPHRGIETITYVLAGTVEHGDSLGNRGSLGAGDVQWMTAPRYQDVQGKDVPEVTDDDGTKVRVVCGEFWGQKGPVEGVAADPRYLDISIPPGKQKRIAVES